MTSARLSVLCAALIGSAGSFVAAGCAVESNVCGPPSATVTHIIDGDTVVIDTGERVRYLMIDTPELDDGPGGTQCFASEAHRANRDLVLGQRVDLYYDVQCRDRFGRLLAYVERQGQEINHRLVARGYACTLHVPPNGADYQEAFVAAEASAREARLGMWGACERVACAERR